MRILAEREPGLFQRGQMLVRPASVGGVDSKERSVEIPVLVEVTPSFMTLLLDRHIEWIECARKSKDESKPSFRKIDPPARVAQMILASAGHWPFKMLSALVTTPTLRRNGSLLDAPGYDARTQTYLQSSVALSLIPEHPSKAEAKEALQTLEDLLREFPFVDGPSKSVALSAMLTSVARTAFDVVPAHGARAPTAGTGKSYIFDIVSAIARGTRCPVIAAGERQEETEKRINGAALSGQTIINIDNVNGTIGGDLLCQIISQEDLELRKLGESDLIPIKNKTIVFFNGNNCRVKGDLTRRALLAELDSQLERPAEREFSQDPVETVLADRGRYVSACLTVLRAYIAAGRPRQSLKPMGGFGNWSNLVRSAIVWLGREDPCLTIETAREEDPELQRVTAFIAAYGPHAANIGYALSVGEIVKLSQGDFEDETKDKPDYSELKTFLEEFEDRGGRVNKLRLAHWLKQYRGRIVGDDLGGEYVRRRIASKSDKHRKSETWFVETINSGENRRPS